ncbi:Mitochondrial translocator assembly and maintenance protein 41 [Borealophlyctis nickersoniae]|nr:Mitochondrial translocator assembly and maintenance protein 41 [Borealophlyctis nickersoniae]
MVDFIFGVTHPEHWHSLNLRQNRHHYSAVGALGSQGVSLIQERIGAGMYYNPDVEIDGMRIKYGVVSMDRLFRDLTEWETLYLAGRLHKPVKIIRDDARISLGMRANLRAAVRTALLLLPNQFTEEELFHTIAGLSYKGDFRMRFGENPHKVYNIVFTQMDAFRALYKPVIDHIPNVNYIDENTLTQEDNVRLRGRLVDKLPKSMHLKVQHYHTAYMARAGKQAEIPPDEPLLSQSIATSPAVSQYVEKALADIVRYPAFTQSIKGFFTAGPSRAFTYVSEKLNKSRAAKGGT